jgi:hypothetical protein
MTEREARILEIFRETTDEEAMEIIEMLPRALQARKQAKFVNKTRNCSATWFRPTTTAKYGKFYSKLSRLLPKRLGLLVCHQGCRFWYAGQVQQPNHVRPESGRRPRRIPRAMDEIKDKIITLGERLKLGLNAFTGLYVQTFPYSLIVTLAIVAALFVGYLFYQPDSKNEQKADEANVNTTVNEVNANVSQDQLEKAKEIDKGTQKDAKEAAKNSKTAGDNYNRSRHTDSKHYGTDAREAGKRFCRQFPDDSSCYPKTQ